MPCRLGFRNCTDAGQPQPAAIAQVLPLAACQIRGKNGRKDGASRVKQERMLACSLLLCNEAPVDPNQIAVEITGEGLGSGNRPWRRWRPGTELPKGRLVKGGRVVAQRREPDDVHDVAWRKRGRLRGEHAGSLDTIGNENCLARPYGSHHAADSNPVIGAGVGSVL